jgi:hypothetical protein
MSDGDILLDHPHALFDNGTVDETIGAKRERECSGVE